MAKPWTAEELAIMKQRYPKEGASDALVKTLNRTKQFGIGNALGIQLLPLGRLLTGCRKEGGGAADEFLSCSALGSCTFVRIEYNGEYKLM